MSSPNEENMASVQAVGVQRPCSAESLFEVMGETASAHLTAKKVAGILEMGAGWQVSGFVMVQPETNARVIVEMSAFRWLSNKEMWWLMHDSAQLGRQLLPNANEHPTGRGGH